MAVNFEWSGCTPFGPTNAPANTLSVTNSAVFAADNDNFLSLTLSSTFLNFLIIPSNSSSAIPPSSTNTSISPSNNIS
ncbi:hypothetical protein EST38_g7384 [Candolleomyces aberdarensis]|uniref:Uncharacterized protein n=1 Tax=Candolleomyces aberdarensis TaxID=2316362 RepID=A0A4Q2DH97_9AGAR|nr:hypothetical protein EST38_g7384 [Candolleomyces aberdarensis]